MVCFCVANILLLCWCAYLKIYIKERKYYGNKYNNDLKIMNCYVSDCCFVV